MLPYIIAPSILSADFARLGEEAKLVLQAGGDVLHFDVMDNHYVPNLTVGPLVCEALRKYGIIAPIDVHLMTRPVDHLIEQFAKAGASYISFHPECSDHVDRSLDLIRKLNCKAGIALNPGTSLSVLDFLLDKIDLILIMSVNPGFAGQEFIPITLEKLKRAHAIIRDSKKAIRLAIDGGIKIDNIGAAAKAGVDFFVAGSAIFGQPNYAKVIHAMRDELEKVNVNE